MPQHIGAITFVVRDYDEAIRGFTRKFGFALVADANPNWTFKCRLPENVKDLQ